MIKSEKSSKNEIRKKERKKERKDHTDGNLEIGNSTSYAWLSLFLLLYVFLPIFFLSLFLLIRIGSPAMAYWCSLVVLSGLFIWVMRSKINVGRLITGCLCFLMIIIFAHTISYRLFDSFYDALSYHQPATARITEGFNPVYDGYMCFGRPADKWSTQATYFPKATWYFAASVNAALGDIQLGKAFHLILFFSALFFVLHHTRGERTMKRLLWASVCFNPIVFYQCFGYVLDGTLGSLSIMALFYANLHFSGKPVRRDAHVIGVVSLAMLFCVKTSGFAYGSIIIFCICLARLFTEYRVTKKPLSTAFIKAVKLGLKIGVPLLLLVIVMGFSPYVTNLLKGKHIFYPLMQSEVSAIGNSNVPLTLETLAGKVHPNAHNRVTRLLRSIASGPSYSSEDFAKISQAEIKNPLLVSLSDWTVYEAGVEFLTGWLGPLFFLLFLMSVPYVLLSRGKGNGWLILTLVLMLFIQPHAWHIRYVPFLWALPFIFCLSTPQRWDKLVVIPVLLAVINTCGVAYFSLKSAEAVTQEYSKIFAPYSGRFVIRDKTFLWFNGMADRFNVRIIFTEDIPGIPEVPVVFTEAGSEPWAKMSEGIRLNDLEKTNSHQRSVKEYWNDSGEIRLFMRVTKKPLSDMEFALTARLVKEDEVRPQKMLVYANNHPIGEWLWSRQNPEEKTVMIPREALEESYYGDFTNLLTLKFNISDAETNTMRKFSLMFEKMEFRTPIP
jgi:hypothetical protein